MGDIDAYTMAKGAEPQDRTHFKCYKCNESLNKTGPLKWSGNQTSLESIKCEKCREATAFKTFSNTDLIMSDGQLKTITSFYLFSVLDRKLKTGKAKCPVCSEYNNVQVIDQLLFINAEQKNCFHCSALVKLSCAGPTALHPSKKVEEKNTVIYKPESKSAKRKRKAAERRANQERREIEFKKDLEWRRQTWLAKQENTKPNIQTQNCFENLSIDMDDSESVVSTRSERSGLLQKRKNSDVTNLSVASAKMKRRIDDHVPTPKVGHERTPPPNV